MSEDNAGVFKVPSLPQRVNAERPSPLNYNPPASAALPGHQFVIDVIKDGSFMDTHAVPSERSYSTFGRLPICDYSMDHGSISRYHAVLQFTKDEPLPLIVDLGSSHGTFVNKQRIQARVPHLLRIGDQVRFGASSRIWILGSSDPVLCEKEKSPTDRAEDPQDKDEDEEEEEEEEEDTGEGSYNSRYGNGIRPGWRPNKHAEYRKDPVKYLRSMLSESGHKYSPERPADDRGKDDDDEDNVQSVQKRQRGRQITVRIELPFADEHGDTLFGTAQSTNQADAERLACLDALEELDKRGYLNTDSGHREDDICLQEKEEDDDFYDQTKPKSSARNSENGVETFETLSRKVQQVCEEIGRVNRELAALSSASELIPNATDEEDELDAYMNTLARGETADSQRRLLAELEDLVAQKTRLDALLRIVEPDRSDASSVPSHPSASAHAITPAITPAITLAITPAGSTQSTKRRMVHRPPREEASNNVKPSKHAKTDIDSDDANISWQPPANQSGDGRTSLNEKLGY